MKIGFAGTPEFASITLKKLIGTPYQPAVIYTQPDRPAGRGMLLTPSAVKECAMNHNIPVLQPLSLKTNDEKDVFKLHQLDLFIVVAYGLLLPKSILALPRLGCINVHASILPRWRGAAPIQRCIEAGDAQTGITIMQMDEGLDTGDILSIKKTPILSTETTTTLHDKLANIGADLLIDTLVSLLKGQTLPIKQNNLIANYAKKIDKTEAVINWNENALTLSRKIRAFNPWPVCTAEIKGKKIKLWEAEYDAMISPEKPGTIIKADASGVSVNTSKGLLVLKKIQFEGGKAISIADALNSKKDLFSIKNQFS